VPSGRIAAARPLLASNRNGLRGTGSTVPGSRWLPQDRPTRV